MRKLNVYMEHNGRDELVGEIIGDSSADARFFYDREYLDKAGARAISISLPLKNGAYGAEETRRFFDGLLPEGFTRRCVAGWLKSDENDYISILAALGKECLGAVRIAEDGEGVVPSEYRRVSEGDIRELAGEGAVQSAQIVTKSHLSLTGASGKVGLYYDGKSGAWYLPVGNAPSTHIVKQSHVRLARLVTNERICLLTAANLGMEVPESFIIDVGHGEDGEVLFATRRYDRILEKDGRLISGLPAPSRLHQEDFAQALGIPSIEKYEKENSHYLKRMFEVLRMYSASPVEDQLKLWDICIFNYLVGNTDNHIKNSSLLYGADLKSIRLAPAYDIVSTLIYESSAEDMSVSIGGKYNIYEITRESFEKEASYIGLGRNLAMARFDRMEERFEQALKNAKDTLMSQGFVHAEDVCGQILDVREKRSKRW